MFDWLIVGAGFAGSVVAERLARETDRRILVIDRRSHVGGNAYDRLDESGELAPLYGRHVLQTDNDRVLQYLSKFACWQHHEPPADAADPSSLAASSGGERFLVPSKGYSAMFEEMLKSPNIKVMVNVDYKEALELISFRQLIFTGSLDEYFDYCYGTLPYWAMGTGGRAPHRTPKRALFASEVIRGRPEDEGGFPVDADMNQALFQRYQELADTAVDVYFTGRLPAYRYCTIDEVVAQSLELADRIDGGAPTGSRPSDTPHPARTRRSQSKWHARATLPTE